MARHGIPTTATASSSQAQPGASTHSSHSTAQHSTAQHSTAQHSGNQPASGVALTGRRCRPPVCSPQRRPSSSRHRCCSWCTAQAGRGRRSRPALGRSRQCRSCTTGRCWRSQCRARGCRWADPWAGVGWAWGLGWAQGWAWDLGWALGSARGWAWGLGLERWPCNN